MKTKQCSASFLARTRHRCRLQERSPACAHTQPCTGTTKRHRPHTDPGKGDDPESTSTACAHTPSCTGTTKRHRPHTDPGRGDDPERGVMHLHRMSRTHTRTHGKHTHVQAPTYSCARIATQEHRHTNTPTHAQPDPDGTTRTHMRGLIHAHANAYGYTTTHTGMHARTRAHTRVHTRTRTHVRTRAHKHTHAYAHAHTQAHAHAHAHAHGQHTASQALASVTRAHAGSRTRTVAGHARWAAVGVRRRSAAG